MVNARARRRAWRLAVPRQAHCGGGGRAAAGRAGVGRGVAGAADGRQRRRRGLPEQRGLPARHVAVRTVLRPICHTQMRCRSVGRSTKTTW